MSEVGLRGAARAESVNQLRLDKGPEDSNPFRKRLNRTGDRKLGPEDRDQPNRPAGLDWLDRKKGLTGV